MVPEMLNHAATGGVSRRELILMTIHRRRVA
jgi:hypothetical protein